ncbi:MAG: HNH endonuclease signature motif containing protein [Coriobacteriia bacterium]|nr:HNH endonuclease signature motif containing protein [Coriobacteriia bacterium]
MPILKENRHRYPKNWKQIRADILERAGNKCEFCGIENHSINSWGSKVVLTIAHLDHVPENCDPENLRALCQRCHNKYDVEHRRHTREINEVWGEVRNLHKYCQGQIELLSEELSSKTPSDSVRKNPELYKGQLIVYKLIENQIMHSFLRYGKEL